MGQYMESNPTRKEKQTSNEFQKNQSSEEKSTTISSKGKKREEKYPNLWATIFP